MLNHITMFQPSAIDNAFSTLQIIHKLIKHMNEVIDEVNSIDSKANEYTDEQIRLTKNELNSRIDDVIISIGQLETELKQFARDYTDTQIDDLKNEYIHNKLVEVYEAIEVVNDRLTTLYERLDIKIDRTKNELEYLIEVTKAELIELIKKGGSVYSAVTGEHTNSQTVEHQIVDVIQRKNGATWNNILNLMMTQTPSLDKLTKVEYPSSYPEGITDLNMYIEKDPINKFFNPYGSNPYIYIQPNNTTPNFYGIGYTSNSPVQISVIEINGKRIPYGYSRLSSETTNTFTATMMIPIYIKSGSDWIIHYMDESWHYNDFKRINDLKIYTTVGVFHAHIYFLNNDLPHKDVTWNDIINSCETNKNYNTWDSLAYYTVKFLGEHLCTEDYNIPIDVEFEEVGTGNVIHNNLSFYHNRL